MASSNAVRPLLFLLPLCLLLLAAACSDDSDAEELVVVTSPAVEGIESAVAMAFAPDGTLFFNERAGRIRMVTPEGELLEEPVATIEVAYEGEWGLLGLALDPAFEENGHLYALYAELLRPGLARPKLVRFTVVDGKGTHRTPIATFAQSTPPWVIHFGGNIRFGPEGALYITVGDYGLDANLAQDLSRPIGKMLRIWPDGSIPVDNPFDADDGGDPRVWAYGLRNNWDFDFAPDGSLWASANGPDRCDHVNLIERGGNYGWPNLQEGTCDPTSGAPPKHTFSIDEREPWETGSPIGPTGALIYSGKLRPDWAGDLFVCAVNTGDLIRLDIGGEDGQEIVGSETILNGQCYLDLEEAPDGSIYFSDFTTIHRLSFVEQ